MDLSFNKFSGIIPVSYLRLPNLNILDLGHNSFSGSLQTPNPGATSSFILSSNFLSGSIPSLEFVPAYVVRLDNNSFGGSIPTRLSKSLTYLFLQSNQLKGSFPNLSNYTSFSVVDVSNNLLDGELRASNVPTLTSLILRGNRLKGPLPSGPFPVANVDLSYNFYEGPIPSTFFGYPCSGNGCGKRRGFVDVSHNMISGPVPGSEYFQNMSGPVNLSYNMLSGFIPSNLGAISNDLYLSSNNIIGPLPSTFSQFLGQRLYLDNNQLNGSIPQNLMLNVNNSFLDLSGNSFSKACPDFFNRTNRFLYVNVSHNQLVGRLPASLSSIPNALTVGVKADLSFNFFMGRGTTYIKVGSGTLFLQNNYLSGLVPAPNASSFVDLSFNCLSLNRNCTNCILKPTRQASQCSTFCNAQSLKGACSDKGTCTFVSPNVAKCYCFTGYEPTSDGKNCVLK